MSLAAASLLAALAAGVLAGVAGGLSTTSALPVVDTAFLRPLVESLCPSRPWSEIQIVEIDTGNTNYCYKVKAGGENLLFLKHAKPVTRRGGGELPVSRIRFEAIGLSAYSKVTPSVVPKVLAYDEANNILALDCISDDFVVLQRLLERGQGVDVDVFRVAGTVMGRSHARSHELLVTSQQAQRYKDTFSNLDALELWRAKLFVPTLQKLDEEGLPELQLPPLEAAAAADEGGGGGHRLRTETMRAAVAQLQDIFLCRKDALIHGDLHAGNILISPDEGQASAIERCRVVDFERCTLGPAGLDLGMFLSGLLVYYVGHSSPSVRRGLRDGVLAVLEAYRASFRVQARSMAAASGVVDYERGLARILTDAVGFAALYPLFLLFTKPEINFMSLSLVPGYSWGDAEGRAAFVRRRTLSVIEQMLALYLRQSQSQGAEAEAVAGSAEQLAQGCVDGIMAILAADDTSLQDGHQTEFWF